MPLQAPQQQQNNISGFLSRYTYILIATALLTGMVIGYFAFGKQQTEKDTKTELPRAVHVLIHDGEATRTWNNVSLLEGDSAAMIVDRIAKIEGIQVSWSDDSKDRSLTSLHNKSNTAGVWKFYMNNTEPLMTIGRYYPAPRDTISLIYTKNNPQ